jgi:hypothetical protein
MAGEIDRKLTLYALSVPFAVRAFSSWPAISNPSAGCRELFSPALRHVQENITHARLKALPRRGGSTAYAGRRDEKRSPIPAYRMTALLTPQITCCSASLHDRDHLCGRWCERHHLLGNMSRQHLHHLHVGPIMAIGAFPTTFSGHRFL